METLRRVLGTISMGAVKIVMAPGKKPLFFGANNENIAADFPPLDAPYLLRLLSMLQGKSGEASPPTGEPWIGKLSLGPAGMANILAGHDQKFHLAFYVSPAADALFESDRRALAQPAGGPPASGPAGRHAGREAEEACTFFTKNPLPARNDGKEISWLKDKTAEIDRVGDNPIDLVLTDMVKKRASDVHLTMGEPVVFRVDGEIERQGNTPISEQAMRAFLDPIIPPANRVEFMETNDTDFAYEIPGVGRFRVNCFRERMGVCSVIRHIPSKIVSAEALNLPKAVLDLCDLPKGLVVVTGPTGSGKSTTLAGMIDYINKKRTDHILTIEDPVEFVHPQQGCLVNQREVHKHTKSFSRALRAALREDPDIVLIGEMRDLETIAIAIETAETGHLVFGTLHTNTAISTVDRIIDQFPADRQNQIRAMLASSLKGVVTQTLLKKKGGGRVAALEILITDDAVANMIREGKIHHIANHMQISKAKGNQLMAEALVKHVAAGTVEIDHAFSKATDKKSFVNFAKSAGLKIDSLDLGDNQPQQQQSGAQGAGTQRQTGR